VRDMEKPSPLHTEFVTDAFIVEATECQILETAANIWVKATGKRPAAACW
jgi:hypothetical protein